MIVTAEIGTTGEFRTRTIGDRKPDIAWAVRQEHPAKECGNNTCDIDAAMRRGYPFVAAWLLLGATETPLLSAVMEAHGVSVHPFPEGFSTWRDYLRSKPKCAGCESRVFNNAQCSNCGCSETYRD